MDRPTGITAVVLTGGDPVAAIDGRVVPEGALVVAADSGLHAAEQLGLQVHVVVGDMDSVDGDALQRAAAAGARIERHPVDKDQTDLELALDVAVSAGSARIIVLGGHGGRLDHLLGNALLIASARLDPIPIQWCIGPTTVAPCRPGTPVVIEGEPGDRISLLPIGGAATGIHTDGLRWRLDGDALSAGSTRGISNQMTEGTTTISVEDGVVLVIHDQGPRT